MNPTEPTVPNPYCKYRTSYSKAQKANAATWADYYTQVSAQRSRQAAGWGAVIAAAAFNPDPTLSKVLAAAAALAAALDAAESADYSSMASTENIAANDPPDPDWRVIAAPLRIWPGRLPKVPGLGHTQQAAVRSYLTAILQSAANDWCVGNAINRGSTALGNADTSVAAAQYRAGAACAATDVRLSKQIPRLAPAATTALRRFGRDLSSATVKTGFRRIEGSAAARREAAARQVTALGRLIALPASVIASLRASMQQRLDSPPSLASFIAGIVAQGSASHDWGLLQQQSMQILAAAAAS
jgi:hypothetical protein